MKKIISLLCAACLALSVGAQNADIQKAAQRNKNHTSVKATVTQTRHNAAIATDTKAEGTFYFDKNQSLSMDFPSIEEMYLAVGDEFTMVRNGKKRVVKAAYNGVNPYKVLSGLYAMVYAQGGNDTSLQDVANISYCSQANVCTRTAKRTPANNKQSKRSMYTKLEANVNTASGEVTRITIYDKTGSYLQYDFTAYSHDTTLPSSAFSVKYAKGSAANTENN